jgi:hypothetical protein
VQKFRIGALLTAIALMIGSGLARWRDTHPAITQAVTVAATAQATAARQAEAQSTPTAEHFTPRPSVAPSGLAVTALHTAEPTIKVEVTSEGLNVRVCAGLKCAVVGSVPRGAVLTVKNGADWGKFVAAKFLRTVK